MARRHVLRTALVISSTAGFQRLTRPLCSRRAVRPPAAARDGDDAKPLDYYKGMITSKPTADDGDKDMLTPTLKLAGGASALLVALLAAFFAVNMDVPPANAIDTLDGRTFEPRGVTPLDTGVFVIGCIPFLWATWEFWRRIAVGASFGTGKDAVVFDTGDDADDDQIRRFGGRRVLGKGALAVAYVLFAAAGGSVLLAVYAALNV
ncbi:unnamed protein product [Pelagomonas calceolata]|uniref:Uncharacterized protein n=1 Tax=Pelagomonas calceolata TaxID=35677 RepID=A0A8J2SMX6_9STRA|nr:unnamed protein product [Pelagomonas calceolata]